MHQLFSRLDAKPNDSHKQENHTVEFFRRISLERLQPRLLDDLYLLFEDAKSLHLTSKRCDRVVLLNGQFFSFPGGHSLIPSPMIPAMTTPIETIPATSHQPASAGNDCASSMQKFQ